MNESPCNILVLDNDAMVQQTLKELLEPEGYRVHVAAELQAALDQLEREPIHVMISEINFPGGDGFELLSLLRERYSHVSVMMITGYGTIESAVEAIKLGAHDYLTKPLLAEEVLLAVEKAMQQQALLCENQTLKSQLERHYGLQDIVGHDYKMSKIFDVIETVAESRVTVLLSGESGTGKTLIARKIHQQSPRRSAAFVEVNCGALPETLLESELFGHVRGAFTGAVSDKEGKFLAAHEGTLFLDEIAVASPAMQVKLLRVLQDRQFEPVGSNHTVTVDVRVILASNMDLEKAVEQGRFRRDLFYRINVVNVQLPPLRERLSDIPLLAKYFIAKYNPEMGKNISQIDPAAMQAMLAYDWPGNVRELENVIERAVVFAKGSNILIHDLPPHFTERSADENADRESVLCSLQEALAGPEKRIIERALAAHNWNRQAAAQTLKINRTTLYKKMKRFGML